MRIHELKTWPEYYEKVASGEKTFEIRKDDRGFKVGDMLYLREWDPKTEQYTNREMFAEVVYMTAFAMEPGYVCMSIRPMQRRDAMNAMRLLEKSDEKQAQSVM